MTVLGSGGLMPAVYIFVGQDEHLSLCSPSSKLNIIIHTYLISSYKRSNSINLHVQQFRHLLLQ